MKTTIELSDAVLEKVKELARENRTTMRQIFESALRQYIRSREDELAGYEYRSCSFKGEGVREGIQEGQWETVRSFIYEGRGG